MSTESSTPDVPVDESTALDPPGTEDEFPFESPEFGVGGFLPHLDPPNLTDGGETR
ncbi:hypothetical protein [Nostocoides sp. F2B08]|uniref:hypothetical protein n=1 Tax=Nostocoides sp. F2B08 TaxID=2653936 RepID=UPI00186B47A1|nr:hypothetical protein [Tetrasphaera sp. F2B08]